jgi:uncharacterized protein (TIGR02271 family)
MARSWIKRLRPGAAVYCTDGRIGRVEALKQAERDQAGQLQIASEPDGQLLEVPFELVDSLADDGSVLLLCDRAELGQRLKTPAAPADERAGVGVHGSRLEGRLELREEQLVPRTELREAGQVRISKEVEEVPRELDVEAYREQVAVVHVPVGQVVAEKVGPWREGEYLIVPVYEEQLEVVRRLVLREQLRIRLETTTQTHHFADSIRRERVVIDDSSGKGLVRERYAEAEAGRPKPEEARPAADQAAGRAERPDRPR